jgi:amino acid permease
MSLAGVECPPRVSAAVAGGIIQRRRVGGSEMPRVLDALRNPADQQVSFQRFSSDFHRQPHDLFRLYWEKGFDIHHWTKTIILVTLMCITGVLAWVIIQLNVDPFIRVLTAGFAIIIGYVCIKLLGKNTVVAYQRAKVSSIDIVSNNDLRVSRNLIQARLNSISEDIEIDRR